MGRPKLIKVDTVDGRGLGGAKEKTITVQRRIPDIMAFRDAPILPYLLLAANPDTSIPVLRQVLEAVGAHQKRSETFLRKRKALLDVPVMPDDADPRAIAVIGANPKASPMKIRSKLRKMGVVCSVDTAYRIWMAISYAPQ